MRALNQCHADHPLMKILGTCNDHKHALNMCLRGEVSLSSCPCPSRASAWLAPRQRWEGRCLPACLRRPPRLARLRTTSR